INAASNAFCSRMAQSRRSARNRAANSRRAPSPPGDAYGITRSIDFTRAYRSATHGRATTARCACGNTARIARIAGNDITASPSQLVARTITRDTELGLNANFQDSGSLCTRAPSDRNHFFLLPRSGMSVALESQCLLVSQFWDSADVEWGRPLVCGTPSSRCSVEG